VPAWSFLALQLQDIKKNEDPRLSFCTPEFKEAQRTFTDAFKVRHVFSTGNTENVRHAEHTCVLGAHQLSAKSYWVLGDSGCLWVLQ
jgi:hypothetical protein